MDRMTSIRRHIIRLYRRDKGYSLYAGDPQSGFHEQPLGVESNLVPRSYILAEKKLDRALEAHRLSWSMSFRQDDENRSIIVAYGGYIEIPNEPRVPGAFFIHALELVTPAMLYPCVNAVVTSLSPQMIRGIAEKIINVALCKVEANKFINRVSSDLERIITENSKHPISSFNSDLNIKCVEQDCAGGAAIAWLLMALLKEQASPPWEVYDEVSSNGGVETCGSYYGRGRTLRASEIQNKSLREYLNLFSTSSRSSTPIALRSEEQELPKVPDQDIIIPKLSRHRGKRDLEPEGVDPNATVPSVSDGSTVGTRRALYKERAEESADEETNNIPIKSNAKWNRITNVNLFPLALIVIAGLSLMLFMNTQQKSFLRQLDEQQRSQLQELSTITKELRRNTQPSIVRRPQQDSSQENLPERSRVIEMMFGEDETLRAKAIQNLIEQSKTEPAVLTDAMTYAVRRKSNKVGLYSTLVLLRSNPEQIRIISGNVADFLSVVQDDLGPQSTMVAQEIRQLLNNQ